MDIKQLVVVCGLTSSLLVGCGGSGGGSSSVTGNKAYSGKETAASLNSENSQDLADSSIEIVKSLAVDVSEVENLPFGVVSQAKINKENLDTFIDKAVDFSELSNLPIGITETEVGSCGGTVTASGSESSFKAVFKNYCETEGYGQDAITITLNGTITGKITDSKESFTYNPLEMTINNETVSISGTVSVTYTNTSEIRNDDLKLVTSRGTLSWMSESECQNNYPYACTYTEYFTADNGVTYRADNYDLSQSSNGWDLSGRVYDPVYGYFDLNASDIQYCTDASGRIESGTIAITDQNSDVLGIQFSGCGSYVVYFNGIATGNAQ